MLPHRPTVLGRRSFLTGLGAVALGVTLRPDRAWGAAEEKKLNFYNWDTYIGKTTLGDFEGGNSISLTTILCLHIAVSIVIYLRYMWGLIQEGNLLGF